MIWFLRDNFSAEEKQLMHVALNQNKVSKAPLKRLPSVCEAAVKGLHFITTTTAKFFAVLGLSQNFLQDYPSEQNQDEQYVRGNKDVNSLKVVNDLAERGVALMQEFNSSLTRNKQQKQFLLQVIEDHRKKFAQPTKMSVMQQSTTALSLSCNN